MFTIAVDELLQELMCGVSMEQLLSVVVQKINSLKKPAFQIFPLRV